MTCDALPRYQYLSVSITNHATKGYHMVNRQHVIMIEISLGGIMQLSC
jgi:hypothetical protein